eukprot:TRINITY_DN22819_c0_g1_i1.p1 TRINITY_DN22819_c0_g1~~TRINITY_DN22819_c0_g1_i1.p1  ORF type:complete len:361 (+),score=109.72 TRINITY_DN22819_c0_g1_i1:111-1193(+)
MSGKPPVNLMARTSDSDTDLEKVLADIADAEPDPPVRKRKRDGVESGGDSDGPAGFVVDYGALFGVPLSDASESEGSRPNNRRPLAQGGLGSRLEDVSTEVLNLVNAAAGVLQDSPDAGCSLMATGLVQGQGILAPEALTGMDFRKCRVHRFDSHRGKGQDRHAHCAFELNGIPGVLFTFEEEATTTDKKLPFKFVNQFVVGVSLRWARLIADRHLKISQGLRDAAPLLLPVLRVCAARGLAPAEAAALVEYAVPDALVPVVLYWRAHLNRWRAMTTTGVVRAYPPALKYAHGVSALLDALAAILYDGGVRPSAPQLLNLLLSLTQQAGILVDGAWGAAPAKHSFFPISCMEDWGRRLAD